MATYSGDVNITLVDGSASVAQVPPQNVQAVIGCSSAGTVGTVVATRSLTTLTSVFADGPLPQACGLALQSTLDNGGGSSAVVLAVRATTATPGAIGGAANAATNISAVAIVGGVAQITYTAQTVPLVSGDVVTIASVGGAVEVNGTFKITVTAATTFTVNVTSITAYTSGGTVQFDGAVQTGTGTSAMWFTGTPTDEIYMQAQVVIGGIVATTGISIKYSFDAGRNFGSAIPLGTALTYAIKDAGGMDTGLTLNVVTGKTLVAGDYSRCHTSPPLPDLTGIGVAIGVLQAYAAMAGVAWGSIHIVGVLTGANCTTLESAGTYNLDALATAAIYTRAIVSCRDALSPTAWGGAGETEAVWTAAIELDFAAVSAKRIACGAGYYNMPSAFPTQIASVPSYRRPASWALAAREVVIPPQRHAGNVGDGALTQVVVNASTDPGDGFEYSNAYLNPTLDYFLPGGVGRFTTLRTHPGRQGFFISNPLSLAPVGSDFDLLPRGLVMDVACTIAHSSLLQFVNADLQTKTNGTLADAAANTIANVVRTAIRSNMQNVSMISGFSVNVDQSTNIQITKTLIVTIVILGRAYALQVNVNLGYANTLAA